MRRKQFGQTRLCNATYNALSLTRTHLEPGGPCTKSMEIAESRSEWVNGVAIPCHGYLVSFWQVTM